ncbi:MAG: flavodoxin family protein [Candidatus Helarchaeales archaeon]
MKVLVTYYTQTGNTEFIAKKIKESLKNHEVQLKNIKDARPDELKEYDLVFLGTGVYANGISGQLKKFLKEIPESPIKYALFVGHANPDPAFWSKAMDRVEKLLSKKNAEIIGKCDYIGENKDQKVVELLRTQMPQLIPAIESAIGHPDENDVQNICNFATKMCEKCK